MLLLWFEAALIVGCYFGPAYMALIAGAFSTKNIFQMQFVCCLTTCWPILCMMLHRHAAFCTYPSRSYPLGVEDDLFLEAQGCGRVVFSFCLRPGGVDDDFFFVQPWGVEAYLGTSRSLEFGQRVEVVIDKIRVKAGTARLKLA